MTDGNETCIYCGSSDRAFRPEHWVPQWLSRAVIGANQMVELNEYGRDEPRYARLFDLTVERVCQDCNNHWMSDIESRTRNLALALIRDDSKTSLSEVEQRRLATWSFLKIISLELGRPRDHPRTFPEAIYSGFRRFQHPPLSNCVILLGGRVAPAEGEPFIWFNSQGQRRSLPGGGEALGYRAALAIGNLLVDVLGLFIEGTIQVRDADPRLVRIWPPLSPSIRLPRERFEAAEQLGGLPYRE